MSRRLRAASGRFVLAVVLLRCLAVAPAAASEVRITWQPARPNAGDVALLRVQGVPGGVPVEGDLDGHPLSMYPTADGYAALVGIDMDTPDGPREWRVMIGGPTPRATSGRLHVVARSYKVQHLTVARHMAELDPETERRAVNEIERLRTLYRMTSGERLWQGAWQRPVPGDAPGTGFGARRVINGLPRAPHSGIDFGAAVGTPVAAANRGRVALVGEFFFPGRLVILDHGLGLYTLYFHLDTIAVTEGQLVGRGQTLGTVGMTGRVTGPHLHFGAQLGAARIDPAVLLGLEDAAPAR
ncbi:MAG: M23 family metallopeptidase [Candidatus Rokubacteria bacterium]|nr:M23 family metallopeptidase [Candidatus Rokubacteria bacterium]